MSYFMAAFLGFIQGLTEFLPVSSSGHLSLIQNLFGVNTEQGNMLFDVILHLGTIIAVFVAYRKTVIELILEFFRGIKALVKGTPKNETVPLMRRFVLLIIIGTLPLALVPLYKDAVESLYNSTIFIGCALLVTGILLYLSDCAPKGKKTEKNAAVGDSLIVGIAQAIAVVPGLSRSGTTIAVGSFMGFDREFAVRFSFILSMPAVIGANILSLVDVIKDGAPALAAGKYIVGLLSAFVFGLAAIKLIHYIVKKGKFGLFAWYCFAVGLIAIILSIVL